MKPIRTWIVIADATRARIAVNDGPGRGVAPVAGQEFEGRNLPGREIMSDRPGRTFDSAGRGRHGKEPRTGPREVEALRFLHDLAERLDEGRKQERYDRLVIVAPPKALGQLRAQLSAGVRERITGSLDKDLTHVPDHQLAEHLGTLLPV